MPNSAPYLLSGSFAYDTILSHENLFESSILPEAVRKLNVAFDVTSVKTEFGGTAGNIAYNASLLGRCPLLIGSLGHDSADYQNWLRTNGLDDSTLSVVPEEGTAHAWILSDCAANQITAFNMGAMQRKPIVPKETPRLWHLAPENPATTAALALQAVREDKEFFFDPGQVLPSFLAGAGSEVFPLEQLLRAAQGIFVNDYEADLLVAKTGVPLESWLVSPTQFIVRTRGAKGLHVTLSQGGGTKIKYDLPCAPAEVIADPTGCGDALRAGFLYGYSRGWSIERCAAMGAVMGSFAIEQAGGQNHRPTQADIEIRFARYFAR